MRKFKSVGVEIAFFTMFFVMPLVVSLFAAGYFDKYFK